MQMMASASWMAGIDLGHGVLVGVDGVHGRHVAVLGHKADLHVAQVEAGDGGLALKLGAHGVGQGVAVAADGGGGVDHHDGLELGARRLGGGTKVGSLGDAVVKDRTKVDDVALAAASSAKAGTAATAAAAAATAAPPIMFLRLMDSMGFSFCVRVGRLPLADAGTEGYPWSEGFLHTRKQGIVSKEPVLSVDALWRRNRKRVDLYAVSGVRPKRRPHGRHAW